MLLSSLVVYFHSLTKQIEDVFGFGFTEAHSRVLGHEQNIY
jgi:hypothetical protein